MNKQSIKKANTEINVPNKYKFLVIKLPNGLETICKSTYLNQDILNKIQTGHQNINTIIKDDKIDHLSVNVDYSQTILKNKDNKKKIQLNRQKSQRTTNLSKSFI